MKLRAAPTLSEQSASQTHETARAPMAKASPVASWTSRWRRRNRRTASDWADLGTAFGLEMSLQPAVDAAAQGPVEHPARQEHHWWQRLRGRRGPGR
jgi:hypothetical protein